jgi:hypothetical protein
MSGASVHPCAGHGCDGCSACRAWPAGPTCCGAPGGQLEEAPRARIPLGVNADTIAAEPQHDSLAEQIARDARRIAVAWERVAEPLKHSSQPALGPGRAEALIDDLNATPIRIERRD